MPTQTLLSVKQLELDLENFRTIPQKNESHEIQTMVSINPDWFWALAESILADGYLPTENIIVIKGGKTGKDYIVKEGNRRISVLKLALHLMPSTGLSIPSHISETIANLSKAWKVANAKVPCAVYDQSESDVVDKIVALSHGKGEKAGRDGWTAVARARHNRDKMGVGEPALDLLEKYFKHGKNVTQEQAQRWSGDYPLTVLDEAMKKLSGRLGATTARDLADKYPTKVQNKATLENILRDVGLRTLTFEIIRNKAEEFGTARYGMPSLQQPITSPQTTGALPNSSGQQLANATPSTISSTPTATIKPPPKAAPVASGRTVMSTLRHFQPRGKNREKVVTLLGEIRQLKLDKHPHAFCFVLRSMFEISAKAYCLDHTKTGGPSASNAKGEDRALVDILRDITTHLTANNTNRVIQRKLHGAITELANSSGILSVTSMNQLVHNPKFTIDEVHIATVFSNIFPLLEAMDS